MNRFIGFFIMVIGLISCNDTTKQHSNTDDNLSQNQIDSILTDFKFQYESPIILDSSDYVLIPISTKLLGRRKSYSKDGYYSDDYARFWNILFYNRLTKELRLLTREKIRISLINAKTEEYNRDNNVLNGKILYQIGDIDYNNDKKLNTEDPEFLFVSEQDGTKLTRISPDSEDLDYYEVIPNSNQILLKTRRDINQDSIFNQDDEIIWYQAELLNDNWKIKEVIDSINRKSIETLYFEQWIKEQ